MMRIWSVVRIRIIVMTVPSLAFQTLIIYIHENCCARLLTLLFCHSLMLFDVFWMSTIDDVNSISELS